MSLELLGAEPRGILIKVRNAPQLAAAQGGAAGAVAATLVPETIENVVLDKMAEQFRSQLRQKGVDADVQVVAANLRPPVRSFGTGVALGLGIAGLSWAGWRFLLSKLF